MRDMNTYLMMLSSRENIFSTYEGVGFVLIYYNVTNSANSGDVCATNTKNDQDWGAGG